MAKRPNRHDWADRMIAGAIENLQTASNYKPNSFPAGRMRTHEQTKRLTYLRFAKANILEAIEQTAPKGEA